MNISTKTQYGMRAMVHLARQSKSRSSTEIASAEHIPTDFLEKILQNLKRAGLVRSARGVSGGYLLAHPPRRITARDIVTALEKPLSNVQCLEEKTCPRQDTCATKDVWTNLQRSLFSTLSSITLADLIRDKKTVTSRQKKSAHPKKIRPRRTARIN